MQLSEADHVSQEGNSIRLVDLIELAGVALRDFKVHCATGLNPTPLEAFFDGDFEAWQCQQSARNFQCERIVSLIHLGGTRWLFAGVFEVLGCDPAPAGGVTRYIYKTCEVPGLDHLVGRVIVDFRREFRASYLRGSRYGNALHVAELRPSRMSIGDFPGYNAACLSLASLRTIIRERIPTWLGALSSVAGVYVITDTSCGKHYVGSARGADGIWGRWTAYAKTGHGGDVELLALLKEKGPGHEDHFQFALLEICDLGAGDEVILAREGHWKDALRSREFGYNSN